MGRAYVLCAAFLLATLPWITDARDILSVRLVPDNTSVAVPFDEAHVVQAPNYDIDNPLLVRTATGLQPEQVHVAYLNETAVIVSWVEGVYELQTAKNLTALDVSGFKPYVWISTKKNGKFAKVGPGQATSYVQDYSARIGSPGANGVSYLSPAILHVIVNGLKPQTKYYYKVGDVGNNVTSAVLKFTTSKAKFPFRFGVLGDPGQTPNTSLVYDQVAAMKPHLILNMGDLSYADNYCANGTQYYPPPGGRYPYCALYGQTFQPRWDSFARLSQKFMSSLPYLATQGNHEQEPQEGSSGANYYFSAYNHRYPSPGALLPGGQLLNLTELDPSVPTDVNNLWYSVDLPAGIHVISLTANYVPYDTVNKAQVGMAQQLQWMEEDLAKVDRLKTPWLIVIVHAPWYTSYQEEYLRMECMRQAYEPITQKYGVDLVIAGHIHAYERTHPVYNNTRTDCGTVHITVGDAGNQEPLFEGTFPNNTLYNPDAPLPANLNASNACSCVTSDFYPSCIPEIAYDPQVGCCYQRVKGSLPAWSAFRQPAFGGGELLIHNATHAEWSWQPVGLHGYNKKHGFPKADKFMIIRDVNNCANKR